MPDRHDGAKGLPLETAIATGAVLGVAALAPSADAAVFTVTNANDAGAGSLRQAILDANAPPDRTSSPPRVGASLSGNQTDSARLGISGSRVRS